jgi:hypothetical protein
MKTTGQKMMAAKACYELIYIIDEFDARLEALVELSLLLDISFKSVLIDFNNHNQPKTKL